MSVIDGVFGLVAGRETDFTFGFDVEVSPTFLNGVD